MIQFHLDSTSGVPAYLQIVQQVRQAISLGVLRPGDQLPTIKEVVGSLAINPNTVVKAYRELDLAGILDARRGQGTFVSEDVEGSPSPDHDYAPLRAELVKWLSRARGAGLDDEAIRALVASTLRTELSVRAVA
ncbi:MAG TPA: GntR family transcriptional regulator [Solirubrobacteraceae bacterium]|jgi:GntR family transcriptional regulator|nr:GntR family transcriptional regulator [Solirubrobacteraceae bacterium]